MTCIHPIIREIADNDRAHDPWGTGMIALGVICDVLTVTGTRALVPNEVGYRPAMGLSFDDLEQDSHTLDVIAGMFPDDYPGHWVDGYSPNLDTDDLVYAARVLHRYLDLVKLAGRDY